jgi:alpha-tubulin suppressor-like RCC1 family protein
MTPFARRRLAFILLSPPVTYAIASFACSRDFGFLDERADVGVPPSDAPDSSRVDTHAIDAPPDGDVLDRPDDAPPDSPFDGPLPFDATSGRIMVSNSSGVFWGSSCVVRDAGAVKCWGKNNKGQLGRNSTTDSPTPAFVVGPDAAGTLEGVSRLAQGYEHGCAQRGGEVYCWGNSYWGALGSNVAVPSPFPLPVKKTSFPLTDVTSLTCGEYHCCAGTAEAGVFCWGENSAAPLTATVDGGAEKFVPYATAADPLLNGARQLSMGIDHACAIAADGTPLCWGRDDVRQAGTIATGTCASFGLALPCLPSPTKVEGLAETLQIAAGWMHSCAIDRPSSTASASVRCWGRASSGELGVDPSTITDKCEDKADAKLYECTASPTTVAGTEGATQVAVGGHTTCAVKDGYVLCWGYNAGGMLGQGKGTLDALPHPTPVFVKDDTDSALSGVVEIALSRTYACALKKDDSVWCWGTDEAGGLGTATASVLLAQRVPL